MATRPRVLQIITHLDMGGAEGVAMELIHGLRAKVDFAVFAVVAQPVLSEIGAEMAGRLDAWGVARASGVAGGFKSGGVLLAAMALNRMVAQFRPDVIHVHTEIPELTLALACVLSRRTRRTPLLRTVHNSSLWISWGRIGRWVTGRLRHGHAVAVSHSAAAADAAIATSRPRPLAEVIYNGVTPPPQKQGDAGAPFHLLFAGRLVHQKGADLLPAILEAAWASTARRDVIVTIAGSGDMAASVQSALAHRLAGWDVRFSPPIERLAARLGDYDAVLLPSRFEGFGLLPLEVLMAGLPIVTTRAPGLDEVLAPDYPFAAQVGDVPALAQHIVTILNAPGAAFSIARQHGVAVAQRFGVAAMVRGYADHYHALAAGGRK